MNNALKAARVAAGLTLSDLARKLDVAVSTVSRIEAGQRPVTTEYLKRCKGVLEVDTTIRRTALNDEALRADSRWLREAFPREPEFAPQPLFTAFRAARQSDAGAELIERLDAQRRSAAEWWAIRRSAGNLNGDEQVFLSLALLNKGIMHKTRPEDVLLPLAYHTPPRHQWLAVHVGPCVYFPQLTIELPYDPSLDWQARKIRSPRLDFLIAVASKPAVYINQEIDGPSHLLRSEADGHRERAIRLPTLRIPSDHLLRKNFWPDYQDQLRELVESQGVTWPTCRKRRS